LMTLRGNLPTDIDDETTRTISNALGLLDNGRILLERDIKQTRSGKP
jgi:hypothetical protein